MLANRKTRDKLSDLRGCSEAPALFARPQPFFAKATKDILLRMLRRDLSCEARSAKQDGGHDWD